MGAGRLGIGEVGSIGARELAAHSHPGIAMTFPAEENGRTGAVIAARA